MPGSVSALVTGIPRGKTDIVSILFCLKHNIKHPNKMKGLSALLLCMCLVIDLTHSKRDKVSKGLILPKNIGLFLIKEVQ